MDDTNLELRIEQIRAATQIVVELAKLQAEGSKLEKDYASLLNSARQRLVAEFASTE